MEINGIKAYCAQVKGTDNDRHRAALKALLIAAEALDFCRDVDDMNTPVVVECRNSLASIHRLLGLGD